MFKVVITTFLCILICSSLALSFGATIYVPDDFTTIQDAISGALNGDTVIVRPGYYYENIDFIGKAITVMSEKGPHVTTIDGQRQDSVALFMNGEGVDSVLDGFTLTRGLGHELYGWILCGGGVYCEATSPTIINNVITDGQGDYGGGVYSEGGSPVISNNTITDNIVGTNGGGILCTIGEPTISYNTITNNSAEWNGGGISAEGLLKIYANTIHNNEAGRPGTQGSGGGIWCSAMGDAWIYNNIIFNNKVVDGGGGGIDSFSSDNIILFNNTLYGNQADEGRAIRFDYDDNAILYNNILWNLLTVSTLMHVGYNCVVSIDYSDLRGGLSKVTVESTGVLNWGSSMIDHNPSFVSVLKSDFHISWNSPCRDTGDNAVPAFATEDFENDPRIAADTIDIGADEFHIHLYARSQDVSPGANVQFGIVGDPGTTPVTLAWSSGIEDPPQSTPYGDLYIILPALWTGVYGPIPSSGVLAVSGKAPANWSAGEMHPLQALIGPLYADSKLTNLLVLRVE